MKLTDELLDDMDCRPIRKDTGIPTPDYIQKLIDQRKTKLTVEAAADPDARGAA